MKPVTIGVVIAVAIWLAVTLALTMTERTTDILDGYGVRSIYTDQTPAIASNWLDDSHHGFTCLFLTNSFIHQCGLDIQVGDGAFRGEDFTGFSALRLAVEYRGPAEKFRLFFRNAFSEPGIVKDSKFHQFVVPIREGTYQYDIPLDNLKVPEWWVNTFPVPSEDYLVEDRSNVIHLGFDVENPMPVGQHFFKIQQFSAVSPWLGTKQLVWWAVASIVYFLVAGIGLHLIRLRLTLKERSEEMFGLLRKLAQADTESAHFKRLSMYDPLTGLLNRRAALDLVEEYGSHNSLSGTALLVLDIDHFKAVNDTYGHDAGDDVLKRISNTIKLVLRDSDAAVRWGGEEIVIICPKTSISGAFRVAEKLREEIKSLHFSDPTLRVTASFGVVEINQDETFDDAFRRADEALYSAKHSGRDRVHPPQSSAA